MERENENMPTDAMKSTAASRKKLNHSNLCMHAMSFFDVKSTNLADLCALVGLELGAGVAVSKLLHFLSR